MARTRHIGINRSDLASWLREQVIAKPAHINLPCRMIVLRHLGEEATSPVEEFVFGDDEDVDVEELMVRIEKTANRDVNGLGAIQSYALYPYFGTEGGSRGRFPFTLEANPIDDVRFEDNSSEPATPKGQLAQSMRHLEKVLQMATGGQELAMRHLQTMIHDLREENERLRQGREQMIIRHERTLSDQHARDLASQQFVISERRKQEFVSLIKMLAPAAINRIAGKNILPEAVPPIMLMVQELLARLDQEKMGRLVQSGALDEKDFMILQEIMVHLRDKEERQAKAEEEAIRDLGRNKDSSAVYGGAE